MGTPIGKAWRELSRGWVWEHLSSLQCQGQKLQGKVAFHGVCKEGLSCLRPPASTPDPAGTSGSVTLFLGRWGGCPSKGEDAAVDDGL